MSVLYRVSYSCDKCKGLLFEADTRSQSELDSMRWRFRKQMIEQGGMISTRYHGSTIHYCHGCADGLPSPKSTPNNPPAEEEKIYD